ncbi:MAG: alpha-L-fucosidase [Polaribacter sp.]|uniref:alpha-L-fucosidase n=1 Tax=Polaribacter sp. TaxID=1920175 RepID=UPI00326584CB
MSTSFVFGQNKQLQKTIAPNWNSMAENYQVPEWFQNGKIGVWMHWGIPSSIDENRIEDGSHYGRRMYGDKDYDSRNEPDRLRTVRLTKWHTERYGNPSEFGYEKFIPNFKAEKFNANEIVKFVKECGARFIIPVATHHDNFDMYDSFFPWNSVKMGPKKDILREWKNAATKYGLKFGVSTHLYWSPRFFRTARKFQKKGTPEWEFFNMDYDTFEFASQASWNEHWYKRSWDLIEKYDPDMFNNDSPYPSIKTGKGLGVKLFSDYLNRDLKENNGKQTTVLSFKNTKENKAAFTYNLERGMFGEQQKHPWIWATDLSGSWFYRKNSFTKMSLDVLIGNAIDAISKNGVVMINIALKGDGTIPDNQIKMLSDFGAFVKTNQDGIYNTRPWTVYGEGPLKIITKRAGENLKKFSEKDIRFTTKNGNLYAFILAPLTKDILIKTLKKGGILEREIKEIQLLGSNENISWHQQKEGLVIKNNFKKLPNQSTICFKIIIE